MLEKGLKKYIFHNSKKEYNIIKKLLILFFCQNMEKDIFEHYILHFKHRFPTLNKGDYLTRIKVLLYYYRYYNEKELFSNPIIDVYDENNNKYKYYKPFYDAFQLFLNIMDKQEEKCHFYQSIHQFNGIISNEIIRDVKMYSGSIISLKDIKFELIKRVNRFFFVDLKAKADNDAFFNLSSEIITINLLSFMDKIDYTGIEKRLSAVILFLIFHEVCGHFKTNINNQLIENSPGYHLDENLNLIFREFGYEDSGLIFESILTGNVINCRDMMENPKSEELFDVKFYIQENFDELKKKIEEFSPKITLNRPKIKYEKTS